MMRHNPRISVIACCAVAGLTLAVLPGCSDDSDKVAVVEAPPLPPPPPPPPAVPTVEELMAELNIDRRVVLSEDQAPSGVEARRAVLEFFDAMARGNAQGIRSMLPLTDQLELNALVESGAWEKTVAQIKRVEVRTGANKAGDQCALAIISVADGPVINYQPQLWYFRTQDDKPQFESAPTPPDMINKLHGDLIAAWHKILEDEIAMADRPDEDVAIAQRNLDDGATPDSAPQMAPGLGPGGLRDPNSQPLAPAPTTGPDDKPVG